MAFESAIFLGIYLFIYLFVYKYIQSGNQPQKDSAKLATNL
jgi:hypothetical protein